MKLKVELFTANICSRCERAKSDLSAVVKELGEERCDLSFVDVVENHDYAVELGVLATPALAVNGKLVFAPLPERSVVLQTLQAEINQ